MKVLMLDPFSGASGDMFLGLLIDLGLDFERLQSRIAQFGLNGYQISYTKLSKNSIAASKIDIVLDETIPQPSRNLNDIVQIIDRAELTPAVKQNTQQVFQCLAEAEAKVHGSTPDQIHFHEVGAVDSIIDIIGTVWGLAQLGVDEVWSRPPTLGTGFISTAHGRIPLPSPATLEILKGVSVNQSAINGELTTPTGAALIKTLVTRFVESIEFKSQNIGYGAGSKDFEQPNVLRGIIGEVEQSSSQAVWQVEVNIDDMNPQLFPPLMEQLLELRVLDVWVTSVVMKKGRPGFQLAVLVEQRYMDEVIQRVFSETSTLGLRYWKVERSILDRHFEEVDTQWGKVKIKIGSQDNKTVQIHPEFESVQQLALANNVSVKQVLEVAQREACIKYLAP
ncbi:nickel pincer cofactor biosynthesis protein LarC [Pseudomonadota bacterium]